MGKWEGKETGLRVLCDHWVCQQVTAETQDKDRVITHLQEKVASLEKRLERNLSGEEHLQELLREVTLALCPSVFRAELLVREQPGEGRAPRGLELFS